MVEQNAFGAALRQARIAEAAQLEAALNIRDARSLRLEILRDAVQHRLGDNSRARDLFDLVVQPGAKPKLWIDLISSVVMEPDPRSYRLVRDREKSSEIVFESASETEMTDYILRYLAQRVVAHDKAVAVVKASDSLPQSGYSFADMVYVWVTGCLFGVMTLLTIAMYLGILHF